MDGSSGLLGTSPRAGEPEDDTVLHIFSPGNLARLLHPGGELGFVEFVVLVDVEVAHVLLLGRAGRDGASDAPRKKATFMYFVKTVEAEEPDPSSSTP